VQEINPVILIKANKVAVTEDALKLIEERINA
jgi:ribosomal protein L4